jgi:NTE family protein
MNIATQATQITSPRAAGKDTSRYVDLVLEGGAVWGVALVGALQVLEERGYIPQNVVGTSAGAIVAALTAAGYSAAEIRQVMLQYHFRTFADKTWEAAVPLVGLPLSVLIETGIHKGEVILHLLRQYLGARGIHTFRDLVHPDYADQPRYRYRLQVIASDITARRMLVLPRDAHLLGISPDDLEVALAVRMSMSIPIFFEPVRVHHPKTGQTHLITDGSMLSNFPVWLFDAEGVPEWPTFGLRLVADDPKGERGDHLPPPLSPHHQHGVRMVVDFLSSLLHTMMDAHDRMYLDNDTFVRTICIPTLGVPATDFAQADNHLDALCASGHSAASTFLETWDFQQYIVRYRGGTPPGDALSAAKGDADLREQQRRATLAEAPTYVLPRIALPGASSAMGE